MRPLLWCAVIVALVAPSATEAQSPEQRAALAAKLLATVQKDAPPNGGTASIIGTAVVGTQTKVYLQVEFDRSGKKSYVNHEYQCTLLDGDAGWMCINSLAPSGLIRVR